MKPALLLIDVQNDFLERKGLTPRPDVLAKKIEILTSGCRELDLPIFHVHTRILRDGSDRMPHWKRNNTWLCIEDTAGAQPPESLRPRGTESLHTKQFFSAFGDPSLDTALRTRSIDTLVIAGLYLHGCIRATILDAYQRGYEVWVADDAIGSNEPGHAEITRTYLHGRAAEFINTHDVLLRLGHKSPARTSASRAGVLPVASIGGKWLNAVAHECFERRNPSNWSEIIANIPLATRSEMAQACEAAAEIQRSWKETLHANRRQMLEAWAEALRKREQELAQLIAREIGKPVVDAHEEISRAITLIHTVSELLDKDRIRRINNDAPPVLVRTCPLGVIGLITPWNNPVAIPVGKIAPALAYGNAVVWKPAIEAPRTAMAVMETLFEAGCSPGLVNLVFGDAATARMIPENPNVSAVSITGSIETGNSIASQCARLGKPLQAELGGNNSAIVLRDCDVVEHATGMAISAFSFSGQRCTRIQRFIVERSILGEFESAFVAAVEALQVGDPLDESARLGPLVSREHLEWMRSLIEGAANEGARILCGGATPARLEHGCWMSPAVVGSVSGDSRLAQEEVFGPVVVILPADDIKQAIEIANGVKHGLLAALYSNEVSQHRRIAREVEAGIMNLSADPLVVHPAAPFGGWKASGIGPPEHGIWDRMFYSRAQAIYAREDVIDT
jgi:acyl-CoA reductase-like NAD-dependent aldehyde dehydrogenase/nicotinamidase-related amidase